MHTHTQASCSCWSWTLGNNTYYIVCSWGPSLGSQRFGSREQGEQGCCTTDAVRRLVAWRESGLWIMTDGLGSDGMMEQMEPYKPVI